MNITTLYIILTILAVGIVYAIYQISTIQQYLVLVDKAFESYDKQITSHQKAIKTLADKLSEYEKNLSTLRHAITFQEADFKEKLALMDERWSIIADDRITSIPKNNKEWYEAKLIIQQPIQKTWKAPKNSQTKQSLVSTTHESDDEEDDDGDGTNQEFTEIDNQQFEKMLNPKSHGNKNIYYHPSKSSNTPH